MSDSFLFSKRILNQGQFKYLDKFEIVNDFWVGFNWNQL